VVKKNMVRQFVHCTKLPTLTLEGLGDLKNRESLLVLCFKPDVGRQ
jgi:hypothetical protein